MCCHPCVWYAFSISQLSSDSWEKTGSRDGLSCAQGDDAGLGDILTMSVPDLMSQIKEKKKKNTKHNKATKTTNNPWKGPSVFNLGGRHGSKRISFAQILPRVPVPHKPAFQGKYSPRLMDNIRCFPQRPKQ